MSIKIITISREYGSGGHLIGQMLAQDLVLAFYDKEIVSLVAKESGFDIDYINKTGETAKSKFWDGAYLAGSRGTSPYLGNNLLSNRDKIQILQSKIIRNLADQVPCVIVGRCADYILNDRDDVLNVFIHSDIKSREKRVREEYNIKNRNIKKEILTIDKARSNHYEIYTGQKWGDSNNYDLTLNSGLFGLENCKELIKSAYYSLK
ncbi:MAG: cytidylate kinase-like family protein [Tissierellia bacterium]|nr:cytidylate kinase-like family protein [Tissierellia bacterium]